MKPNPQRLLCWGIVAVIGFLDDLSRSICDQVTTFCLFHDVYNVRMAETYLATANYVWPAAVDTVPLVKT